MIMFGALGNLTSMLRQAQQIGGRLEGVNAELKNRRAIGTAGGGMVEIEVNGLQEVLRCKLDAGLVSGGDRELLEDLVCAAINDAQSKSKQLYADAMKSLMGGVELPGLSEALAKLTGGQGPPD
jgi:nucleoid-associated protein EbfC